MYNYYESVKEDVKEAITTYDLSEFIDLSGFENRLNDDLFIDDSVTGNASGSYTFNSYRAKEYVTDNEDLLREMVNEFCIDGETVAELFLDGAWEYFDVCIRCYVLGSCISEALEELNITEESFEVED